MHTSTLLFATLALFFGLLAVYMFVRLQSEEDHAKTLDVAATMYLSALRHEQTKTSKLRQALLFYANETNWTPQKREGYPFLTASPIAQDQGQKARDQFPEFQWSE